ncbi:MAG: hypothetical protein AB7H77_10365 [Bdellovibrionales bacterium]
MHDLVDALLQLLNQLLEFLNALLQKRQVRGVALRLRRICKDDLRRKEKKSGGPVNSGHFISPCKILFSKIIFKFAHK